MAIRSTDAIRASLLNNLDHTIPNVPGHSGSSNHSTASAQARQRITSGPSSRNRLRQWITGAISAGALGLMLCSTTGCTTTSGLARAFGDGHCLDDFMIGYRNKAMAEKAWHCQKDQYCNQKHSKEFKQGFCEGFMEVTSGGNGCVPAVAPKQYWGWRYQSAQGQGAVNAWFEGYPMGVRAAEELGVGHWGEIRTTGIAPRSPAPTPVSTANPFYGSPPMESMPRQSFPMSEAIEGEAEDNIQLIRSGDSKQQ